MLAADFPTVYRKCEGRSFGIDIPKQVILHVYHAHDLIYSAPYVCGHLMRKGRRAVFDAATKRARDSAMETRKQQAALAPWSLSVITRR